MRKKRIMPPHHSTTLHPHLSKTNHRSTSSHPSHRSSSPHPHPNNTVEPSSHLYYFENFPHNWTSFVFRKFFSKHMQVDSVYASPRLNKASKKFGFLKTPLSPSLNHVINWISSLWIGSLKFHINPAEYSSPIKTRTHLFEHHIPLQPQTKNHTQRVSFKLKDDRTIAEVTKGILGPPPAFTTSPPP